MVNRMNSSFPDRWSKACVFLSVPIISHDVFHCTQSVEFGYIPYAVGVQCFNEFSLNTNLSHKILDTVDI